MEKYIVKMDKHFFRYLRNENIKCDYIKMCNKINSIDYSSFSIRKLIELKFQIEALYVISKRTKTNAMPLLAIFISVFTLFFSFNFGALDKLSDLSLYIDNSVDRQDYYYILEENVETLKTKTKNINNDKILRFIEYIEFNREVLIATDNGYMHALEKLDEIKLEDDEIQKLVNVLRVDLYKLGNKHYKNKIYTISDSNITITKINNYLFSILIMFIIVMFLMAILDILYRLDVINHSLYEYQIKIIEKRLQFLEENADEDNYIVKIKQI